jgi:hypothetical protein
VGLSKQPVARLSAGAEPWFLGSLTLMFSSGIPLFMSESIKCYYSFPFWVKMTSLLLALVFTFTIRRHLTRSGLTADRPRLGRLIGAVSLCLWFGVAWGGPLDRVFVRRLSPARSLAIACDGLTKIAEQHWYGACHELHSRHSLGRMMHSMPII